MLTIKQLEDHIFSFEMVRVIFRAPTVMLVHDYPFKNQISDTTNFSVFKDRLSNNYTGLPFFVVDGYGVEVTRLGHKMGDIRKSYLGEE